MSQIVPILVYHHVYEDGHRDLRVPSRERATGVIGESELRRHLSYLADEGWEVVSMTQLIDWLENGASLPRRSVALHFDNGWLDTRTLAMRVLGEFEMIATCFVISDGTDAASRGERSRVHTSTEGSVANPSITWDQAQELLDAGWEIGAHSATHPRFADLHAKHGEAGVFEEVQRSNEAFAEHLGFVPPHFAYPSGSRNEITDALLAPHYRSLRRWHYSHPPRWRFTDGQSSPLALECQNVDSTVSFEDFTRIFAEALASA